MIIYKGETMKTLTLLVAFTLCSISYGGPGHSHGGGHGHSHGPVDVCKKLATKDLKTSSMKIGKCHISRFITAGKINKSWTNASLAQNKSIPKRKEWLVTFKNDKGVKGKELFIFLSASGSFVAANFTGK
jgi:hypothetical protein